MVITIQIWFGLTIFRIDYSLCTTYYVDNIGIDNMGKINYVGKAILNNIGNYYIANIIFIINIIKILCKYYMGNYYVARFRQDRSPA